MRAVTSFLLVLAILTGFAFEAVSQSGNESAKSVKDDNTQVFLVLGNCVLCKDRIETATNTLPGIIHANWSATGEKMTVTFDDTQTNLSEIMHTIASVGHDTEWYPAPDEAYDSLIGTCCEYDRWLTYSGTSVNESEEPYLISISPNPAGDFLFIITGKSTSQNIRAEIYSLSGKQIVSGKIANSATNRIDVSFLEKGIYVVALYENGKLVHSGKISKS